MSLPAVYNTEEDTSPNEPLMVNADADSWESIEADDAAILNPTDASEPLELNSVPATTVPPSEPLIFKAIPLVWVYPPMCPTLTTVTVSASLI